MCFKPPKPPKVYADPALKQQQLDARASAAAQKADDKEQRTQMALERASGRVGRNGLLGNPGAGGYASPLPRSLFVTVGG